MQTFVVRLWAPASEADGSEADGLRGVVDHVASGSRASFRDEEELIELLGRLSAEEPAEPEPSPAA